MGLLVKYTVLDGKADAQSEALKALVRGLKSEGTEGFSYTAFATDDPTRFIAVFDFTDDAGKKRFLESAAFAQYRDTSKDRFPGPPETEAIHFVASTED